VASWSLFALESQPVETVLALFAQHGLLAVFAVVLIKQLGAPVPAMPVLLLAGVAAADDGVFAVKALALATLASVMADFVWFYAGRRFGRRVLTLICRISISPDSCVRQNEVTFARWGVATLVIAKFVPGLAMLAPPVAGAVGMRARSFAIFNTAGAALWAGSGIAGGLIFHDQIGRLLASLSDLGREAVWVLAGLLALYVAWRSQRRWRELRTLARLPRVRPSQLAEMIERGEEPVIVDVRAWGVGLPLRGRIPGALHLELAGLETARLPEWPKGARIITYCDCPHDASASKAAHLLAQRGRRADVLSGGLDAWMEAGYPVESV
jgi:membrane protein DedA with SNARE-associated domain/rhodanese-related sulfurtransferase